MTRQIGNAMIILKYKLPLFCLLLAGASCTSGTKGEKNPVNTGNECAAPLSVRSNPVVPDSPPGKSRTALYMDSLGLQADNFTGEVLYDDLLEAYLHPDAAHALVKAQKALKRLHPSYSLLIYDAARPMTIQKKM